MDLLQLTPLFPPAPSRAVSRPRTSVRRPILRTVSLPCLSAAVSHAHPEPSPGIPLSRDSLEIPSQCRLCGRRRILEALAAASSLSSTGLSLASASPKNVLDEIHPRRQWWYEEFYACQMDQGMKTYESQMAGYKTELFKTVSEKALSVLEIGVGAGPNIRYYANRPEINITGVDPNPSMEKYARSAAFAAGLQESQFKFIQGVAESLPVETSSFDAVICTLVLCSVIDVSATLNEVKRVLRPGGSFFFIEHVAAPEGSSLRFWQDLFDPVQQFIVDGCHLTRDTLNSIESAKFTSLNARKIDVPNISLISPHIIGVAQG